MTTYHDLRFMKRGTGWLCELCFEDDANTYSLSEEDVMWYISTSRLLECVKCNETNEVKDED